MASALLKKGTGVGCPHPRHRLGAWPLLIYVTNPASR